MVLELEGMRRRDFLAAIGKAAGSSAVLRTMAVIGVGASLASCDSPLDARSNVANPRPRQLSGDWPSNVGAGKTVVILGGGIAGMTAAIEMTRLGYSCTILEATKRAGGRTRTVRGGDVVDEVDSSQVCEFDSDDDLYFNPGPSRIPQHHELLLGYCRAFGVPLEAFINDNRAALLHSETSFGGQPQIARRVHADSRGNIARLLALAVNQNALDEELSVDDKRNILDMLATFGDLDRDFDYTGTSRGGFPGQEDTGSGERGELVDPLELQELLSDFFWQSRQDFGQGLEQQSTMLQPVGGMDRIAIAFEEQVKEHIIYEAVVTDIQNVSDGVQIAYDDGGTPDSIKADYCICTIPAPVLEDIPNNFSPAHQREIKGFSYTAAGKIAFQSRRFWEQDHSIYGGISWTTQNITQIWYPNSGFGQTDGVVVGAYIFGGFKGSDFADQTPAMRIETSTAQANALHPEFGQETERGISIAWSKVPYQLGAWGQGDPGVLLTADGNVFFAGEHLSILQGWQEGAILSSYHAIDLVVARDTA